MQPAYEAQLVAVDVADTGQDALVEQGLADRPGRVESESPRGHGRVPVLTEQIGAEVADGRPLVIATEHLQGPEQESDGCAV